jgi:hypothetical protein
MIKLKTKEKPKIAIGTLIQWYEVEIVSEYLKSLVEAIKYYSKYRGTYNKDYGVETIYLDFEIHSGTMLEKPINDVRISDIVTQIKNTISSEISQNIPDINVYVNVVDRVRTVADYRRDFNTVFSTITDILVWGETDMIFPKEYLIAIDGLHTSEQTESKYVATFGITKMWDDSWKPLEHRKVADKPFIEGDTENWWSVRHTITLDELNNINDEESKFEILNISPLKFNGCGLVISSELVKSGVNIPNSIFFVHEDTAFMLMCQRIFPNLKQYHIANILMGHNRKHPKKRSYIQGEEGIDKTNLGALRKSHEWYPLANQYCEMNCHNLFNENYIAYTWDDVFAKIQH